MVASMLANLLTLKQISAEFQVIYHAPVLALGLVLLGLGVGFAVGRFEFKRRVGDLEERVKLREDQVQRLETKLSEAKAEKSEGPSSTLEGPSLSSHKLQGHLCIEFSEGDHFEEIHTFGDGSINRLLNFKISNGTPGFLTDCTALLRHTHPEAGADILRTMSEQFSLAPGQPKWIRLAEYSELRPSATNISDFITLGCYHGSGYSRGKTPRFPACSSESPLLVTVEVVARECRSVSGTFKLWIEQPSGKLRGTLV